MVHLIEFNGKFAAYDVESGSLHEIDRTAMRVLTFINAGKTIKQILNDLGSEVATAIEEIEELKEKGLLFSNPTNEEPKFNEPVVKALCILIAQDCNLKCTYCFADGGEYKNKKGIMDEKTACAAIDFLIKNSGNRKNLEVDFFGGEPLLNFKVLKTCVAYAKEQEKLHNKNIRFTLTTNAFKVDDEIVDFINKEMKNIVISIDGRKEIHDAMRKNLQGNPSYEKVLANAKKIITARGEKEYYIRGTYTSRNLDFSSDVIAIAEEGFCNISLEPVVAKGELAIRQEHLPQINHEYNMLAREYLKRKNTDKAFNFFHFMVDLDAGPCINKRLRGCGAGSEYLAVLSNGDLYPCHQFAGNKEFYLGNIYTGIENESIVGEFKNTHIYSKQGCNECWAKYLCSGGCMANAYFTNEDIKKPYKIGCDTEKKRLETALALKLFE